MGPFDTIAVELGPAAYAEPFVAGSPLVMPANALVNVGYLVVGGYWLSRARTIERGRHLVVAFATASLLYAFVQLARIVTQTRAAAIADQWATLPFFALVVAFALELSSQPRRWLQLAVVLASTASYLLALVHPRGFDLALAMHIAAAVTACLWSLRRENAAAFVAALLCCLGFVFLKLGDFWLAGFAPFQRLTGHFWSKVCDALQIHFVLVFFTTRPAAALTSTTRPAPPPPAPRDRSSYGPAR
jgi:hypothetical protein